MKRFSHLKKKKWKPLSLRVMLTSALRALVNNLVKESFYGKRKKKKQLIFWQFFSFPIKVMSKLSLIGFLTSTLRALISISLSLKVLFGLWWSQIHQLLDLTKRSMTKKFWNPAQKKRVAFLSERSLTWCQPISLPWQS